jgi:hypothetical protein
MAQNLLPVTAVPDHSVGACIFPAVDPAIQEGRDGVSLGRELLSGALDDRTATDEHDLGCVRIVYGVEASRNDVIVHGWEVGLRTAPKRPIDLVPRVALALDKQGKPSLRD